MSGIKKHISQRERRHDRVRKKVAGTKERPRLSVRRSLKNMFLQLVDDKSGTTIVSASTLDKDFREKANYGGNVKAAALIAELLAKKAKEKNVEKIVFDRGGYAYHGRVRAVAETLRKEGLQF